VVWPEAEPMLNKAASRWRQWWCCQDILAICFVQFSEDICFYHTTYGGSTCRDGSREVN
jgi:hypothetical protein